MCAVYACPLACVCMCSGMRMYVQRTARHTPRAVRVHVRVRGSVGAQCTPGCGSGESAASAGCAAICSASFPPFLRARSCTLPHALCVRIHFCRFPSPLRTSPELRGKIQHADVTGAGLESIQMPELKHALAALEGGSEQSAVGAGGAGGQGARQRPTSCLFKLICSSQVSSSLPRVPSAQPSPPLCALSHHLLCARSACCLHMRASPYRRVIESVITE